MVIKHKDISSFMVSLSPGMTEIVEKLRILILSADNNIAEQIKWNSPSYYFTGPMQDFQPKEYKRDILVMNVRNENILLIFPTGDRIENSEGVLEGNFADGRRMIKINSLSDVETKAEGLKIALKNWIEGVI